MSTSTARTNRPWLELTSLRMTERDQRRRTRRRNPIGERMEVLEDRTLLNGSTDVGELSLTASTINAVQGARLVDVVVGSFTIVEPDITLDGVGSESCEPDAGDFRATIDWGDGSMATAGAIVQDASTPSIFYVMGTHVYYENSSGYTTTVTVQTVEDSPPDGGFAPFNAGPGDVVSENGTAVVANAPINLTVGSFAGVENVSPNPSMVVVATFVDQGGVNPDDSNPVSRYIATIDWGDGSGVNSIPTSAITQNGTSSGYTIKLPQRVYSTPGVYVVTVTVNDGGEEHGGDEGIIAIAQEPPATDVVTATATGVAHIADAPLSAVVPQPTIPNATAGTWFANRVVGSFTDGNPLAKANEFAATIDWGDGSPRSSGALTQPGGPGSPFFVTGSHVYANAQPSAAGTATANGTYPIQIFVQGAFGSSVNLSNMIKIGGDADALTVTGQLNPASDSGVSSSDAITNVVQPNFFGVASEAGALVSLYATPLGGSAMLIGQATADANGAWSITSNAALADGGYLIQAQARDASGDSTSPLTTITPELVIDTVGPKVTDARFDSLAGRTLVTFEDFGGVANAGSGLNQASLTTPGNYRFSMISTPVKGYRGAPQWLVTGVNVQPGTNAGGQFTTVVINNGRPIRGGNYLFDVLSANPNNPGGVDDIAGNALDGAFYGTFPSGGGAQGGNFSARLDSLHGVNYPPRPLNGSAAPGRPGVTRFVGRGFARPGFGPAFRLGGARNFPRFAMARPGLASLRG